MMPMMVLGMAMATAMTMMIVMMVMISTLVATFFFLDLAAQGRCYRLHMLCSLLCSRAAQKW